VLWANLHGSFLVGLFVLGLFLLGQIVSHLRSDQGATRFPWHDPQTRRLFLALVISSAAAALLNPVGPSLYFAVIGLGNQPSIALMNECRPLWESLGSGPVIIYAACLTVLGVSVALSRRPPSATELLLLGAFGILTLLQRRMITWFLPLVPWIAVR